MRKLLASATALLALVAMLAAPTVRADDDGYSMPELQQLLAPIALYPDTVLTHVLIAATYPIEVVQADRWARKHSHLKGQDAVNAAEREDWDPSVKALLAFPDLLSRMSEDLLWTQQVGEAFLANETKTLEAIQALRLQAWETGTLEEMEHLRAVREEKHISIQPVRREVVYVPYYDPRVAYGSWYWTAYPPVYWSHPVHYRGGFYWGYYAPVGDWFYFSGVHWPRRTIIISHGRPYYHYSHRQYGYYQGAQHWRHNPYHRRGVYYHNPRVRQQWEQPQHRARTNTATGLRTPERHRTVTQRLSEQPTQTRTRPAENRTSVRRGVSEANNDSATQRTRLNRTEQRTNTRVRDTNTAQPAPERVRENATPSRVRTAPVREASPQPQSRPQVQPPAQPQAQPQSQVQPQTRTQSTIQRTQDTNTSSNTSVRQSTSPNTSVNRGVQRSVPQRNDSARSQPVRSNRRD